MAWKHYEPWKAGTATVVVEDEIGECRYDFGAISTGRQRVFHRFYARVEFPDSGALVGEDPHSVRAALDDLDRKLQHRAIRLVAAGLDPEWVESGLSQNTGFGYLRQCDHAVHMFEVPPTSAPDPENDLCLENLIREAVAAMRIGIHGQL